MLLYRKQVVVEALNWDTLYVVRENERQRTLFFKIFAKFDSAKLFCW